jgi:Concanavalin A-like lectin/glucanases superfamily
VTRRALMGGVRRAGTAFGATLMLCAAPACNSETRVNLLDDLSLSRPDAGRSGTAGSDASAGHDASATIDAATLDAAPDSSHLIHRYSFDGDGGTQVVDSVGNADGTLMGGATLDGAGHATLDGQDDFADLPNGLVSKLSNATLIAWLSWSGGPCWQRVFDFGSTDAGEGIVGNATTSIFATPLRCPGSGPATSYETTTSILGSVDSDTPFPELQNLPIAVVYDVTGGQMRLYAADALLGTGKIAPLSQLQDVNDWLGRSQWVQDIYLRGTYDEFRIYDIALSPAELAAVEKAGPDVVTP